MGGNVCVGGQGGRCRNFVPLLTNAAFCQGGVCSPVSADRMHMPSFPEHEFWRVHFTKPHVGMLTQGWEVSGHSKHTAFRGILPVVSLVKCAPRAIGQALPGSSAFQLTETLGPEREATKKSWGGRGNRGGLF